MTGSMGDGDRLCNTHSEERPLEFLQFYSADEYQHLQRKDIVSVY